MACRLDGAKPWRRQAIISTNAGILLIGPLGTNFIEISIGIQTFSFKKMHLKMSSAKWRPFCLGLNVLNSKHYVKIFSTLTSHERRSTRILNSVVILLAAPAIVESRKSSENKEK